MYSDASRIKQFVNLLVFSLAIYGVSQKDFTSNRPSFFDEFLINTFSPLMRGITSVKSSVSDNLKHYLFSVDASKENKNLKTTIHELETKLFVSGELSRENRRLKDLLRFGEELVQTRVLAQVVGWDSSSNFKVLRINKGKNDGIKNLDTVVTAQGLVGHVYRATKYYSDILTILDQNNRADAVVARTRSHGIVEGYSGVNCIMKYVTRTEPIRLNDKVITSGLSRIYPKGLMIGQITKIERESFGITQYVEVTPEVDYSKLEEVVVLLRSQGAEQKMKFEDQGDE